MTSIYVSPYKRSFYSDEEIEYSPDMFFEPDLSPDIQNETALVVTKTIRLTATVTLPEPSTVATTATVTAMLSQPKMILEVPRYPAGDTTFCILFAILCIVLTVAIILRKQSKKLKAFNIPLILGAFCTPTLSYSNLSYCIGMFSPRRLPVHQEKGRYREINSGYPYPCSNILLHGSVHYSS